MSLRVEYAETWTCDHCGREEVITEVNIHPVVPYNWRSVQFIGIRSQHDFSLCPKCFIEYIDAENKLLASFVLKGKEKEALEAGVPLADILVE